jgi:hypothetical protein
MSLTIDELNDVLLQAGVQDAKLRSSILKEARALEEDKKAEKDPSGKKSKYNYTIVVRSDNPAIKDALENTEAFIAKTAEEVDQGTILERMKVGAIEQNRNCKKKGKIFTVADYFGFIKSKNHKIEGAGVKNVSKQPVRIIVAEKAEIDFS